MIRKLLAKLLRPGMSELGKELHEAMETGTWTVEQYKVTHKESGISLWTANGYWFFRLYDVAKLHYANDAYRKSLNWCDRQVLWRDYRDLKREALSLPTKAALNVLLLARMKGESK